VARRRDVDLPPEHDEDADPSSGADLEALFAECDASALPRQHAHVYLDASWTVDDLAELERIAGTETLDPEAALDPETLAERLAVLPLAELLGLPPEYAEYMRDSEAFGGGSPVEEDEGSSVEERASDVRSESESGVARPPAEREGEAGVGTDEEAAGRAVERVEDVSSGASVGASPPRVPGVGSDDDELDALLESATIGEARVAAGGFGSGGGSTRAAAKPPPATSAEDDDAFLDELLGES
jgi:hypothetical protein